MSEVTERILRGDDLIETEPGLLTPLPWPDWKARIRSLEVDGARADYVEYDPYRFVVPPLGERRQARLRMMLVVILSGTSIGTVDQYEVVLTPKQAVLIDGRASMDFHAPEPLRAVRLFVDEDHLPAESLEQMRLPYALLKAGPLVAGCVGLITGLLQVGNPIIEPHDAAAMSRPLVALQASLLDEALHREPDAPAPPGRAATRARIDAYVDEHLGDRGLNVHAIAEALGMHVRSVHAAYEGSGTTAAQSVRDRRVAKAKAMLALRREPPNVAALASRVGLTRDQLTRAFKARSGSGVVDWWREHGSA